MTTPLTSVLIVDDEPAVRDLMVRWVAALGLRSDTAASAEEALATLRAKHYDLAVIDVMMPGHTGLWLAHEMQRDHPNTALVIATGYAEIVAGEQAPTPVADFLVKPFQRERFMMAVDRGRQWRKQTLQELQWHAQLSMELEDRTHEICARLSRLDVEDHQEADLLIGIAQRRTPQTMAHGERVARYTMSVARELGLAHMGDGGRTLELAAVFHDIGKAAIPDALLSKPSPLTPGEAAIVQRHAAVGAQILSVTSTLAPAAPLVLASHEWFGGGGYPTRMAGTAIPIGSRIIAVADAYDAMTQDRCYRSPMGSADAMAELLRSSPTQFDPNIVAALLAVLGRQ